MALKIKKGDRVKVVSGKDKGTEGLVLQVLPEDNKVLVEGINVAKKHVKPSPQDPKGGIKRIEQPVHASNVMVIDGKEGRPARIARRPDANGKRVRVSKRTGLAI